MEEGVWVPKTPAKSILARWGPVSVDGNWKNHVSGSFSTGTSHDSAEFNAMSSADSMDAAQALKERIANEFDLNKSPCELGFGDSSNGDCEDILAGKQGIENHDLQTRNRKCIDLGYLKGINGTEAHLGGMAESSGLMSSENSSRGVNSCGTILACLDKICFTELLSLPVETLPAFETCATPWGGVGRMPGDGVCPTSYSKNDSSMNIPLATSSFAEFGNCVERKDNTEIYGFHGLNQDKHEDDDLFAINKDGNEKFRPSVRSASTGFSTPSKKGNARYNDDVNLNKQSRTKRKRYWPKVAVEGKLKKTPKPSTPKPSTPKPRTPKPPKHATCKKGSVEKRKYVRKNNLKGSTKPSKDIGVDRQTFDASTGCVLESGTPALNSTFFLENHECEYVQNNRITASARRALKFNGKDAGIIIHQYQRRKKKKDSSSHDTNSIVQQSKEDNESMVENSADMAFGFTQSKKWNKTTYMEERGATNDGTNQTGCHYNSMKVYRRIFQCLSNSRKLGPNFPKICKQRRMRRLKTTNFASFGNTAMYGTLQSIIAAEDGQRILKKRRLRRRKATKFGTWWSVRAAENEQTWVQPNNVSSTPIDRQLAPQFSVKNLPVGIESCDIKFLFTIANCNFVVPNYSGIMISPTIAQRLKAVNDPDSFKCVLSLTPFATTTKKRSNESTRRLNLGYTTLIPNCNQLPSAPCTQAFNGRVWNQAVLLADNKNMVTKTQFKMGLFLDNAVYGHNKMEGSPKDVLSTQKSIQDEYSLAFTDVIERLEGLHISNEHGQLIVYNQNAYGTDGGHGPVIPYNPKKRKPPPKVDIDQETMRVWKLLMENGGEDVEGEKAEDKEKWWEEQREVFRGRVDSFIARMHLIQGDRRFLPWKGSVVDSVVGVFLTQNVSDHLSSSAFMSLTAKYPLRPTTNHKACDEDEEIACSQESVGSSIGAVEQTLDANSNGSLVSETKLDLGHQLVENNVTTAGREISDEAEDRTVVKNEFSPHNFVDSVIDGNPTSTSQLSTQTLDANSNGSLVSETKLDLGHQLVENNVTTAGREISDEAEDRTVVKDEFSPHDFVDSVIDGNPTSTSQLSTIEVFSGITEIVQLEETACLLNFSSCENGNLLFNESLVDCDLSRKLENEKQGASPNILFDENDTHAHVCSSSSQNPYSYIPLTPADLEADSLEILAKSTNTKTKDVGDIRKIIGCVESSGSETIVRQKATPRAQEATVDQCASLSKCQVLPECSSQTEVNRAKGRLSSKNHHGGSKIIPQTETPSKRKKSKFEEKQDNPINWDDLRKTYRAKETTTNTMDSLDWEEVRQATVDEVADAIKGRGQHRVLAGRIKEFLDRVVRDHGSLNLEWLRDVPPDKAKDYLLSFKGLGLKSVECVRLLSLHHHAFPVDVNVGRVAVRLGWVPLQPLPESLQIHLLEQYPLLDTIQVYLWPRLCTLDQRTLYELHYQMITFGKVFCRKRNPNCNACPMKGECRHFASAFASARLALPGPQEKSMVSSMFPGAAVQNSTMVITPVTESLPEATFSESRYQTKNWKPIIEHPPSPVPDSAENLERDIEDFYYDEHPPSPVPDSAENLERDIEDFYYESEDDIPTVRLDTEEFKEKLREFIYKSDILLEEGEMSNALVALTSEAASMSVPKLKQVSRLRTVHHVYELPDSHIILKELEKREPDDPSPYLLAIWNSGETSNSSKSPRKQCDSLGSEPCNEYTCSSCNNSQDFQTVSGTILIPCRTATRGSFPLNGTYFQVNEVFADYESSEHPLVIPRSWIWNLRRRTLYCGAYGSAIFRGLSMQEIQSCFWRGFVCVRAFNRKTRAPAHLAHRFHISTVIPKGKRKFTEDQ